MAKTKERTQSFASIIRGYYEENPDWLRGPSNEALVERWRKDHPGEPWTKRHQQGAANEKTKLRKKHGLLRRRKRRGRGAAAAGNATGAGESRMTRVRSTPNLEQLELHIDECLALAARHNNPALDGAVKALRVARRNVAWAMGEPRI